MKKLSIQFLGLALFLMCTSAAIAQVKPARIFSSNMVLQQNALIPVWGWAAPGEKIIVTLGKQSASVRTAKDGKWMVRLKPFKAGGPYEMNIKGKNTITYTNVLIGEVWVCSGQSNMEFKLSQARNAAQEIAGANYPKIRLFTVPKKTSLSPLNDMDQGEWVECTPETAAAFSAVGYFFGRELLKNLDVPIGLIHSSWGGTNAESWTSAATMNKLDDFRDQMLEASKVDATKMDKDAETIMKEWRDKMTAGDLGISGKWQDPSFPVTDWQEMKLPTLWEDAGLPGLDGVVWFRKEFNLSAKDLAADATLSLGPVDDSDDAYLNGKPVGSTWEQYDKPRMYTIPARLLHEGVNTLTVRVTDSGGGGGIYGDKSQLFLQTAVQKIPLDGLWKYKVGIRIEAPKKESTGPNAFPTLLYNGMIYPLVPFAIKGVIWYQGENNAGRAYQYRTLFPAMINDWRNNWGEGNFPFLFVQLANFMAAKDEPSQSAWAELREAQSMTLVLPNTGMALAIDIGEAKDIHPKNKQDVGKRLALSALNIAYLKDIVSSGPTYHSLNIEGDRAVITFGNTGSGLVCHDKYGYLKGFAICGADKKFYWARADIEGNKVVVHAAEVKTPVAVRYAWADNPDDANLYNGDGLPAVPFRTDQWPGITAGVK